MQRILAITLLLLATSVANAQSTVIGEVVDVVNGKTVVLMLPAGKTLVELQYIEVPEPEQALHATVAGHLRTLVAGRRAEYKAIRLLKNGGTVGRLIVGGIDVSQQMLRDGAAWHAPNTLAGQGEVQWRDYAASERAAREEKRGVWNVAGLKPAWIFRAEQAAIRDEKARATEPKIASAPTGGGPKPKRTWGDANPQLAGVGAFATGYNAATGTGFISTTSLGVTPDGTEIQKNSNTAIEITYLYRQASAKQRTGTFVVTLTSVADEWRFLKENTLDVVVDEKVIKVGRPKREESVRDGVHAEKLTYYVDRSLIERMANGDETFLKIGKNLYRPTPGWQLLIYNLAQVSK